MSPADVDAAGEARVLEDYVAYAARALGLESLDIEWEASEAPGGNPKNIAFVRSGPDLRQFVIEHNFADCDPEELRTTVLHELLHIALRHLAGTINCLDDGYLKRMLLSAIEEDTEVLAAALKSWFATGSILPRPVPAGAYG